MSTLRGLNIRQLRTFEAVSRLGSYTHAAKLLHLSQPAVSMQITELTKQLQMPLLDRVGRRLTLTAAGEVLYQHARVILRELHHAAEAVEEMRGLRQGTLKIAAVSTAKYFAPFILAGFKNEYPEVALRLLIDNREKVLNLLHDNEIDFAIMGRAPDSSPIIAEAFAEHPMAFITTPDHPLAKMRNVQASDLADIPFVLRETGSGTRTTADAFFQKHAITPPVVMEAASNETIKQSVMAGLGCAFISLHCIALELRLNMLAQIDIADTPIIRQWHVAMRKDKQLMPAPFTAREFILSRGQDYITSPASPV